MHIKPWYVDIKKKKKKRTNVKIDEWENKVNTIRKKNNSTNQPINKIMKIMQ